LIPNWQENVKTVENFATQLPTSQVIRNYVKCYRQFGMEFAALVYIAALDADWIRGVDYTDMINVKIKEVVSKRKHKQEYMQDLFTLSYAVVAGLDA
jgi:hypothetical protein